MLSCQAKHFTRVLSGVYGLLRQNNCVERTCVRQICFNVKSGLGCVSQDSSQQCRRANVIVTAKSFDSFIRRHVAKYSSKSESLTDDILKSKIATQDEQPKNDKENSKSNSSKKDKKEDSWFSGKNAWKLGLISLTAGGLLSGANLMFIWGAPGIDKDGNEIIDEYTLLPKWKAYFYRASKEFTFFKQMIQEPSSQKLLPDTLKEPYFQPPYTLVLEMTGVLVHPDWTMNTGWRFKKRPAVEYFLQQVSPPLFEVVVYTREQGLTAYPIINGLDPNGFIAFRLFRDATRYVDGHHVKDLDYLNRDLSKVIVVDCDPNSVKLHPRNAIQLSKWKGSDDDRKLVDLAAFLRTIAASNVDDVRPVLEHYSQFDDPLEAFKDNQRRLKEEQEQTRSVQPQEKKSLTSGWSLGLSGRRGT